ncbi:MAG: hypothetical protein LBL35_04685 [Clostridiales bacterium]|jgi:hypothetical protein|nr:hypothetical protein [Clostridiales bacterium]
MSYDLLLYIGVAVCAASVLGAIIAAIIFAVSRRGLNKALDAEYGKRRH